MAEAKKTSVYVKYDMGDKYNHSEHKGEYITLYGVKFENDGKGFKAELKNDSADAMIKADRAVKA